MIDRAAAWGLLTEFTQSESLRKHALAVEACMRAYARKLAPGSAEQEGLWASSDSFTTSITTVGRVSMTIRTKETPF